MSTWKVSSICGHQKVKQFYSNHIEIDLETLCGEDINYTDENEEYHGWEFCPYCGKKMRGDNEQM